MATPKGYVPVIVGGSGDRRVERFMVHVKVFKEPWMVQLLDKAAAELGYRQDGVLRIPCDVDKFREVINWGAKSRAR